MDLGLHIEKTLTQTQKMHMGMHLSNYLEKSWRDFWKMVREVEDSSVFRKIHLFSGDNRVIKIKPIRKFIPIPDSPVAQMETVDVETLLKEQKEILYKIREIGRDKFVYYFLEGEGTDSEVAQVFNIPVENVREFRSGIIDKIQLVDAMSDHITVRPTTSPPLHLEIAAELYPLKKEIQIDFTRYRTRYIIEESGITTLHKEGKLTFNEIKEFNKLKLRMSWINLRFNLINQVIETAVAVQTPYLLSNDETELKVFHIGDVSHKLDVDISWISRLIKGKYIKMRGKLLPLRSLFISERELKKRKGKRFMRIILEEERERINERSLSHPFSDENVRLILLNRYNYKVTRRTINNWRWELKREMDSE
ncbi:MAG: hypothetical protein K8T10_22330 [Candidatus Eremiobacteraeota bacterium]|nr:hypothetical protein [Candidatus Eremiobacteraeota bacterium]